MNMYGPQLFSFTEHAFPSLVLCSFLQNWEARIHVWGDGVWCTGGGKKKEEREWKECKFEAEADCSLPLGISSRPRYHQTCISIVALKGNGRSVQPIPHGRTFNVLHSMLVFAFPHNGFTLLVGSTWTMQSLKQESCGELALRTISTTVPTFAWCFFQHR